MKTARPVKRNAPTKKRVSPKNKGGNPAYIATDASRRLVRQMTANGATQSFVAFTIKCSVDTLQRHYRDELDFGVEAVSVAISNMVYKLAISGDRACMFFWLKCRAGWRETAALELSGPGGGAISIDEKGYDLSRLSLAEQLQMEELMQKVALPAPVVAGVYDNSAS
jgi:hypothetical protein